MLFQFLCWTASIHQYLWFGSCTITTYFLSRSPLPGFNERKSEHHPLGNTHFIGLGLRWKRQKKSVNAVLTSSSSHQEQFQLAWSPGDPEIPMTPSPILISPDYCLCGHGYTLCCSWLSPLWGLGISLTEHGSHTWGSQFGQSAAKFPQSLLHWQWFLWKADIWLDGLIWPSILLLVVVSCTWL